MPHFQSIAVYCRSFPDDSYSHIAFVDPNLSVRDYQSLRGADVYEFPRETPSQLAVHDLLDALGVSWLAGTASGQMPNVRIDGKIPTRDQWNPPPIQ